MRNEEAESHILISAHLPARSWRVNVECETVLRSPRYVTFPVWGNLSARWTETEAHWFWKVLTVQEALCKHWLRQIYPVDQRIWTVPFQQNIRKIAIVIITKFRRECDSRADEVPACSSVFLRSEAQRTEFSAMFNAMSNQFWMTKGYQKSFTLYTSPTNPFFAWYS